MALTVILVLGGCGKEKEKSKEKIEVVRPVKVLTVQGKTTTLSHGFPGKVRAARRSELSFKVSGPLVALPAEEGQQVKKGTLLAQIQQRDFQIALDEAKAQNLAAEKQFRRYKELYAKKQVSLADFDSYRARRDVARAQLEDARNALKDTSLLAPFDGVVSRRFVENFQKVQAKEPIVNFQDITQIEILVDVPELLMAGLQGTNDVQIHAQFESIPDKEYALSVKEFATQADPATQTYQVVLLMQQPEEANIFPGMTALVTARSDQDGDAAMPVFSIPAIAVMGGGDNEAFVWVLDKEKSKVHKVNVAVDRLEGSENIIVTNGLKAGETIVIAGVTQLEEGMQVRPWEKQREGK